ncbi:serine hydrolase domain-containing protein [Actinoplanes sp. NBRC 101535]|uniref:serine hydrolase domain-containing protein n=1 Tax=Actinoplanes sp. NBRC 101535 TaxID=3032196 RepID=UPI0024A3A83B|nr:serine hydrolase domain-containing protein [Actinoplanes sp. NBRC 101535]GLY06692.1 hypothetical protein Acsp01_70710 [Actinoplanes sp. NBRC 101535]
MGWDLGELLAEYGVPGAQVAVLSGGVIRDEAAGVLNLRTGVAATTDAVFKVGSITKIWTATLIQQLAAEGVLDLDRPVRDHLPGFRLSDPAATATLTTRHLLTHTGGVDGNHFVDTGRNDDAIARFVDTLATADHLLPPGSLFSYSNSGYVVLGRLVEVLRGAPFHDVLRERLVAPLGLRTAAVDTYEAILQRAAVGHVPSGGQVVPVSDWAVSYYSAPSGSHFAISARELLEFVRLHLTDPALAVLREPQLPAVPNFGLGAVGWGLGWMLHGDGVVGHTGVSKGQKAFLRHLPFDPLRLHPRRSSRAGRSRGHHLPFPHRDRPGRGPRRGGPFRRGRADRRRTEGRHPPGLLAGRRGRAGPGPVPAQRRSRPAHQRRTALSSARSSAPFGRTRSPA